MGKTGIKRLIIFCISIFSAICFVDYATRATPNRLYAQMNVPRGWMDGGGLSPIYPAAVDDNVQKQVCIGTNTAVQGMELTIKGTATITNKLAVGTTTISADSAINVVGSITIASGSLRFSDNSSLSSAAGIGGGDITSGSVTTALGYTPVANTSGSVTTALGYTPVNNTNGTGTGNIFTSATIDGGTVTAGLVTSTNLTVTTGTITTLTGTTLTYVGTITANSFVGNGSQLTGIATGDVPWSALTGDPLANGSVSVTAGAGLIPVGSDTGRLGSDWIDIKIQGTTTATAGYNAIYGTSTNAFVQRGIICLWSGSSGSIPNGWQLCDGTNDTPDLRDRFIVGAGNSYAVNATGGTSTHSHTTVAHTHSIDPPNTTTSATSGSRYSGPDNPPTITVDSHTHTVDIASFSSASESVVVDNATVLPPYYALCYIMKL